jgi:signal transduction histidine kinase
LPSIRLEVEMDLRSLEPGQPGRPTPDLVDLFQLNVHCDARAPGVARHAFDSVQGIDGVREHACLVVTELVTNAVRHSGCTAADLIEVRASRRPGVLEIAVTDRGLSRGTPRIRPRRDDAIGGLGLPIVAKLAAQWGTLRTPDNRCLVWAELATS